MDWLRLNVSNLCNFKCPNCHVFELGENNLPSRVMSKEVFVDSIEQFVTLMDQKNHKETKVSIYGGETLANKKVIKECILLFGSEYKKIKLHWIINTNGSLLKEEDVIFFKDNNVEIHISVDGQEDIHNISRPTHKGKGTFHMVVPALELIRKYQPIAQLNSYMMPSNYLHLKDIVDIAEKYDIKRIYLDQFYNLDMISHQVGMDKYREVYFYALMKKIQITGPWAKIVKLHQGFFKKRDILKDQLSVEVNIDGTFYFPISIDSKKEMRNIKDLNSFFDNGGWERVIEQMKKKIDQKCDGCSIVDQCYGTAVQQVQYHISNKADTEVSCNFFRDWCNFLMRPVQFKNFENFEVISLVNLDNADEMFEKISSGILMLEEKLWKLKSKIIFNIMEFPEELKAISGQYNLPAWVRATTSGETLFYHVGTELTPALVHELTHLFIAQKKFQIPGWMIEGICEWTQDSSVDLFLVKKAMGEKDLFALINKLKNENFSLIDLDKKKPFENPLYIQAKGFVSFLHGELGQEQFSLMLNNTISYDLRESLQKLNLKKLDQYIAEFQILVSSQMLVSNG
ncbi:MAG: radical SAM protein [Bacteriovorax sp.]|nr:radical SAM protein [Bacteriovorax sp.]